MSGQDLLRRLRDAGALRPLDVEIGRCLLELEPRADPLLGVAAAVASLAVAQGHACLPLRHIDAVLAAAAPAARIEPLDLGRMRQALIASRYVAAASARVAAPLVMDAAERLYLGRYFDYEQRVARRLCGLLQRSVGSPAMQEEASYCDGEPVQDAAVLRLRLNRISISIALKWIGRRWLC